MNDGPAWAATWHVPGQTPQPPPKRSAWRRLRTLALIAVALAISSACVTSQLAIPNLGNPSESGPSPAARNTEEKLLMLELINDARARAGVAPVTLGNSPVPQLHAENMLAECFISHWGTDGLKPYMRHSLAGGIAANGENAYSRNECGHIDTWFIWTKNLADTVREANDGLYRSPGHRTTMLDATYTTVSIGLAWNWTTFKAVQHFEGPVPSATHPPRLLAGRLQFQATLPTGAPDSDGTEWNPILLVLHDPPPRHLRPEQLAQTSCYEGGTTVAALQHSDQQTPDIDVRSGLITGSHCPDPYQTRRLDGRTTFTREYFLLHQSAKDSARKLTTELATITVITVPDPLIQGRSVSVDADLSQTLDRHGPGVYTVHLLQTSPGPGAEHRILAEHSIFHETPLSRAQLRWTHAVPSP